VSDQGQATPPNKSHNRLVRLAKGNHIGQEQIIWGHACKCIPEQEQEWRAHNHFLVKDWAKDSIKEGHK